MQREFFEWLNMAVDSTLAALYVSLWKDAKEDELRERFGELAGEGCERRA
jgi:hypothetical protein